MTRSDEFLIQRLLDGELPEEQARALRERLKDDPRLRLVASRQRLVSRCFEAGRDAPRSTPPRNFVDRVLAAARRPEGLSSEVRLARALSLAAAFILGVSLLVMLGVVRIGTTGALTAADLFPERLREDQRKVLIQRIDELEDASRLPASRPADEDRGK